ncbi:MAG TPA: hypothetical protein VFN26_17590 [Candidatus Acidoferrum sp.]|nr:hypothetical protein [Candidatus Acidoferrum sp.]
MTLDDIVSKVTDPYERPARLYPALLALLPLLALIMFLYGPKATALTGAVTVAVSCGGLYLTTNLCRELGKRLEEKLYRAWGGKPTTQLLRHRDQTIEAVTKRRYHAFLAGKINVPFPDKDKEANDPGAADDIYQSGVRWLLNHTRPEDGKKFDLIFKENVAYGFRRNALGVKPFGLLLSAASLLWVLVVEGLLFGPNHRFIDMSAVGHIPEAATASLIVSSAMIFTWLFFFTETSARTAAFTYAETLLRACDSI